MSTIYDAHKARLAACARKLVKPPYELLHAMFIEREREVHIQRAALEQELEAAKRRAQQAALRIYLSQNTPSFMRRDDYVTTIHALEATQNPHHAPNQQEH